MENKNKSTLKPSPLPFIFMNDTEGLPAAICRNVCVEWVNLGEGVNGDYDPQDPNDVNLLRYDAYVYEAGRWNDIENASYCTCMPADAEPELLGLAAAYMARELAKALADPNRSVKLVAGKLSWLGDGDFSDEKRTIGEKNNPLPGMSEKERSLWAQLAEIAKNEPKRIEDPDGRAPIAVLPDDVWAVLRLYVPSRTGVITTQSVYDALEAPLQKQIDTGFCPEGFYSDDPDVTLELATCPEHYVFSSMREDLN